MERLDARRPLIRAWDSSGMREEDSCCSCCEREAGSHRHDALVRLLRQRETRLRRMARVLAAAFILVASAALALLVMVALERRGHQSPDSQAMKQPDSHASGSGMKQQQPTGITNPCILLTAPYTKPVGEHLEWENVRGIAYFHGGFNYSNGTLVVPRGGIYRVFLQITYQGNNDCPEEELMLTNKVFLSRDSYNDTVPLLSSFDTLKCSKQPWRKSLFTAGSFFLEANSRLFVKSSHPEFILNEEYMTFFGAELLPQ